MDENEDREQRLHDARMEAVRQARLNATDAARYRWLRARNHIAAKLFREHHNETLDDAIDKAMASEGNIASTSEPKP